MDRHLRADARDVIEDLGERNESFAGARVLVTGAAGFLGAQFVHYFAELNEQGSLAEPVHLIALDNYSRGRPAWLTAVERAEHITVTARDITAPGDLEPFDFIVHAASIASPTFYRKYPIETIDANVTGLRRLLDHAVAHPPESFLFFSSSEVYGDPPPEHVPTAEDYWGNVSCTGPRACYDESKRFGETLCMSFLRVHGVPCKIVRPFNNYGPGLRLDDGRVISDFFRDVIADRDIVILSDGRATRTFCYVADAMKGYLRALLSDHDGEPFNIGVADPEISIRELAAKVVEASEKPLGVRFDESRDRDYLTDNPQRRCPNIDKAAERLGYRPTVSLEEGLQRSYRYYLDQDPRGA